MNHTRHERGPASCPGAGDPVAAVNALGAIWSDDLAAYAAGQTGAKEITCALCMCCPCRCPPFGSPAYWRLIDARHGRNRVGSPAHPHHDDPTEGGQP